MAGAGQLAVVGKNVLKETVRLGVKEIPVLVRGVQQGGTLAVEQVTIRLPTIEAVRAITVTEAADLTRAGLLMTVGAVGEGATGGAGESTSKGPYEIAESGGKHSGFLTIYKDKPASQIQKGISSLKKQIAKHRDKIANPKKHIRDFDKLDSRQQDALLNKQWPSDIARQQEQLEILEGLLKNL